MKPVEFCYWLQGLIEVGRINSLDKEQVGIIKKHLDTVFTNVTNENNVTIKYEKNINPEPVPYYPQIPEYNIVC